MSVATRKCRGVARNLLHVIWASWPSTRLSISWVDAPELHSCRTKSGDEELPEESLDSSMRSFMDYPAPIEISPPSVLCGGRSSGEILGKVGAVICSLQYQLVG